MKNIDLNILNYNQLLSLKLKDLHLSIEGSLLEGRIMRLFGELEHRGFTYKPHIWISDDWFTPDDIPGFSVPFYLLHKKLINLEKKEMFEAEGQGISECMKILRHETGHAISHAYRLYNSKKWEKIFGKYDTPYPLYYSPNPGSKNFVVHLNAWYSQAHPVEDFAETFAVWLNPKSNWEKMYSGWPARKKLEYVDQTMNHIKSKFPVNKSEVKYQEINKLNHTISDYYMRKKKFYTFKWPEPYDKDLKEVFNNVRSGKPASAFLKRKRTEVRNLVAQLLDVPPYSVDQLFLNMMRRCKELDLKSPEDPGSAEKKLLIILAAQIIRYIQSGYFRIPL